MRNRLSFRGADDDVNENILLDLQTALHMHNPHVNSFKQAIDIIKEYIAPGKCSTGDIIICHNKLFIPTGSHERTYNATIASEVEVVIVGGDTKNPNIKPADVVVQNRERAMGS
ncbi:Hypothetical predicted protein [Octopus vulgaris]|uniref:Uncharacterized protein n=1 Tax=Octopus vulgaris TaxID=6645 RepID=A0AA36FFH3_OCTVU|nr:Hypothetical predicted protein [Octopus vulgaris]